jgi:hypothetical protein
MRTNPYRLELLVCEQNTQKFALTLHYTDVCFAEISYDLSIP